MRGQPSKALRQHRFRRPMPSPGQAARLRALELMFVEFEDFIVKNTKFSREQGHAITKLQECQFWCLKAIEMEHFIGGAGDPDALTADAPIESAPSASDTEP